MVAPTAQEQYLLELTNRARLDPHGEYDRLITYAPANVKAAFQYFKVDLAVLKQQIDALTAVAPLVWNEQLAAAAYGHSYAMIKADLQSHQVPGEAGLGQRFTDAGYQLRAGGENIYAYSEDPFYAHAGFFIDWGPTATGIQDGAGHRVNIMSGNFTEVGMTFIAENNSATAVGPFIVTEDFGNRANYKPQITGVVINDKDGDQFYDVGEGVGGVNVKATGSAGTYSTTTWDAGGYNLAAPAGTYQVTFTYGDRSWSTSTTIGATNVKVDAEVAKMSVANSVFNVTNGSAVGGVGNDTFVATTGNNIIDGGGGWDVVYINGSKPGYKVAGTGLNKFVVTDGDGAKTNTLTNVELVLFDDGNKLRFDIDGNAGKAYRLYQAAFDRVPDKVGLGYWINELDAGHGDLTWVANNFIISQEFKSTYGSPGTVSDSSFLTLLYNNVLDRSPDASGFAYWTGELARGFSRDRVLASFSESIENKANVADAVHDGIWFV